MKGPGRHRYAVRRQWECPVCKRRELTDGNVTTLACHCLCRVSPPAWPWMRLVEEPRPRPLLPQREPPPVEAPLPAPDAPEQPV